MPSVILGKDYQPQVKDVGTVLVGVAQVRIGMPSIRPAGTAVVKGVQFVGTSTATPDTTVTPNIDTITPLAQTGGVGNTPAGMTVTSPTGTYTGAYDGCFIIRATSATLVDIYAPDGYKDSGVTVASIGTGYAMKMTGAVASGLTLTGVLATTITAGMTWIIPVWSGVAQNDLGTGIWSPYSMFSGSNESVGGLKSASFTPKLDSMKTLEAGFPSVIVDRMVEKTSVDVKFDAYEYNNANMAYLKTIVGQIINQSTLPALPVEVVMRTRNNSFVGFWIPNCSVTSIPSYAPDNDYSTLSWDLSATKQTEYTTETAAYNSMIRNTQIYYELTYVH